MSTFISIRQHELFNLLNVIYNNLWTSVCLYQNIFQVFWHITRNWILYLNKVAHLCKLFYWWPIQMTIIFYSINNTDFTAIYVFIIHLASDKNYLLNYKVKHYLLFQSINENRQWQRICPRSICLAKNFAGKIFFLLNLLSK